MKGSGYGSGSGSRGSSAVAAAATAINISKVDRKMVEKNRRIQMKTLCFKLSSLIPNLNHHHDHLIHTSPPKDALSQHDHLDHAATYIKQLRERIDRLKQRKKLATCGGSDQKELQGDMATEHGLPVVEVRHQDTILEVVLITSLKNRFMFYEVLGVLEEEGEEIVNASFSVVGEKIFYTIHSQAISPRIGLEASRVAERLKELIQ